MSEEVVLPSSLSRHSLETVLRKKFSRFGRMLRIEYSAGAGAGDHYSSQVGRMKVGFEEEDGGRRALSLVYKQVSQGPTGLLEAVRGVEKEAGVYTDLVPFANRVLPRAVAPECYYISPGGDLLLEDLRSAGYSPGDRVGLLDLDRCRVALGALALFHAASVKAHEMSPKTFNLIGRETVFTETREHNVNYCYCRMSIERVAEVLSREEEGRGYTAALAALADTFWERMYAAVNTRRGFSVLNHGDFRPTNILFRESEGRVTDAKMVDFQYTRYSSPALDLHTFVCAGVRPEVREAHLDSLLDGYLDALNGALEALGSGQRLARNLLDQMMDDTAVIGVVCCFTLLPVIMADPADPLQLGALSAEDFLQGFPKGNPYSKAHTQHPFKKHILSLLKYYTSKNYI